MALGLSGGLADYGYCGLDYAGLFQKKEMAVNRLTNPYS
jgi:hypothetical protein